MKRNFTRLVSIVLAMLFVLSPAASETSSKLDMASYLGDITVYCRHWNNTVGKEFGVDMTFDSDQFTIIKSMVNGIAGGTMDLIVANYDGIIVETDWNYYVYSLRANATPESGDTYWALSRICAIISTVAYDFPHSENELSARFIDILTECMDFLEVNLDDILSNGSKTMQIKTGNGDFDFDFVFMDDGIYLSWGTINYPKNN